MMKNKIYRLLLVMSPLFLLSANTMSNRAKLVVVIKGVSNVGGYIEIGIYNNPKLFPEKNKQFREGRVKAKSPITVYTFEDLAYDDYAVGIYHDENGDRVCNRSMLGIPKEGYCFSKNFKPKFSAPDFSDCSFNLTAPAKIEIDMIY